MESITTIQLGPYRLTHRVAHGGMSEVYLAHDDSNEQLYAVKIVSKENEEDYLHFQREMQVLNSLQHPHILPILAYTEEDDLAYCVMPYIEYGTLRERIATGPLNIAEAGLVLAQAGEALQFMHEAGLVHRDIKPSNILLDAENYVWLADFGLAKEADTPSDLTGTGRLFGTPSYLAPELLEQPASASSDLYALGIVLYEMLTGTPPFTGPTPLVICSKHAYEFPPLPSRRNPLISPAIEEVILRSLEKDPAERFASAGEMIGAYQQALTSPAHIITVSSDILEERERTSITVRPVPPGEQTIQMRLRRRPVAIAAVILAVFLLLGATSLAIVYQATPRASSHLGAQMISEQNQVAAPAPSPPTTTTPKPTATASAAPKHQTGPDAPHEQSGKHKRHKKPEPHDKD